ncbi:hypothetical protein BTO09_04930 [Gilvibacter sp. SZ-19]|uniref:hypothetical protein n=1 Tax=Gilvibacter sp. SZ-19 TaxID=754429 RepID=UPI000B3CEB21|nr:hypothetical protein [Gilvibacter sp. SZ-19]ARV11727.1 hypothetical protein BTO09_04930 [Gilvibacter sp. SZ-19]
MSFLPLPLSCHFLLDKKVAKKSSRLKWHLVPCGTKPFGFSESRAALQLMRDLAPNKPQLPWARHFIFNSIVIGKTKPNNATPNEDLEKQAGRAG